MYKIAIVILDLFSSCPFVQIRSSTLCFHMTADRVVTNLSATQASSDPAPEVLLTPAEAKKILRTLSPDKIDAIARASTGFATKDGLITDQTPASIMSKTNVVFAANKSWSLAIEYVLASLISSDLMAYITSL
jgi:hypothetical protein